MKPIQQKKPREYNSHKGWKTIDDKECYFKSKWEYKYAMYLQMLKKGNAILDWEYEPKIFYFEAIKRGTRSYTPDFKVIMKDGKHSWVEVKGYMDAKSVTKIKRFNKYYPQEDLQVITEEFFKRLAK